MDSYAFSTHDDEHLHQPSTEQPQEQHASAMTVQTQQLQQSAPAAGRPQQQQQQQPYVAARGFNNAEVERKVSHESKPRLSKEQHDILENHFKIQPKPSTQTKKGFADSLGVPLDKINNWFQNRRAKVKQENKKRQQAYNLYFTPAGAAAVGLEQPVDSAWIDPSFYQTVPRHSMMVPPTLPVVAEVGDPMAAGGPGMMQPMEEGAPVMMTSAGPEPMFNEAVFQQFFGFPEAVSADHNVDLSNSLNAFSKQFNSQGEAFEPMMAPSMDFEGYHSSAPSSLMTRSSNDDSSIQLSSISGDSYMWDSLNSAATTNSRPSLADSRSEMDQSNYTYMLQQSRSHSSLPVHRSSIQQTVPENAPNFDDIHPDNTMSKGVRSSISEQAFPTPPEQFFSRAQAAIHDAQMSSAGLDELAEEPERPSTAIRQSSESNLAARRRQRPANLIPLRTSSYNATSVSTPSPSSMGPNMPEHAIRRIKSSTGVMTGRIQKPSGPNPRSPHYMNFSDASNASARLNKSIPVSPMTAQHQEPKADQPTEAHTGPLTPPSPNSHHMSTMDITSNFAHHADVVEEMMWSQMTELDQLASSSSMDLSQESNEHRTEARSYESPPSTPRMGHSSDSAEDSCEPQMFEAHHTADWQQSNRGPSFHPSEATDESSLVGSRMSAIDPTMAHNAPVLASAEDAVPPRLHHSLSHQQFGWHVMPDEREQGFASAMAQMPKSASDLYIHEWAPQDAADSESLPPKAIAGMQLPRNYQFSHHTPATFSSP